MCGSWVWEGGCARTHADTIFQGVAVFLQSETDFTRKVSQVITGPTRLCGYLAMVAMGT